MAAAIIHGPEKKDKKHGLLYWAFRDTKRYVKSITQWETRHKHTKMPERSKKLGLSAKEILTIIRS